MEIPYKEVVSLADGSHEGVITKVLYRTEPYEYTDVFISTEGGSVELKAGFPTVLSNKSSFGQLLTRMGVTLVPNMTYNPETLLIGKKVSFITMTKKGRDGNDYSNIINDSVKLMEEKK